MLRIYSIILTTIEELRGVTAQIERRDRDLGRQLRRAASSVSLNVGEGQYSRGALRQTRYHTALGSAREVLSCLETARAWGYVGELDEALAGKLNQIIGTLVRLVA
jgi:four helix bundle protein